MSSDSSSNKTWNWGVYGTGRITHDFLGAIQSVTNARVLAICGTDFEHTKKFASEHGVARVYGKLAELLDDSEIDFLYISTIHSRHKRVLLDSIPSKKHILCEKPLTCNASETREVVEAARKHGCFLMEALWSRYFPIVLQVRGLLLDSVIGDVQVVSANMSVESELLHPMANKKGPDHSALLDLGIYPISFAAMVFGYEQKPSLVKAFGFLSEDDSYDVSTFVHLEYPNGGQAFLSYSSTYPVSSDLLVIQGSKGTITIPGAFWCPTSYSVCLKDGTRYKRGAETDRDMELPNVKGHTFNYTNSQGLAYEIAYAQHLVETGRLESDQEPLDETIAISEIMTEVSRQLGLNFTSEDRST
ncbi:trans-1,2-dihydrobenzene-1,2-diol dehydrogenase-like [Schistocerca gregaria]|uniref:trans-1,2-dihydrobenzene-1,2-diol dehydrogenase-like n=1 Tax=Schistocerca gregaria TaxID=7010 RepID=UPI00211E66B1|nr:trans-1,2-dihydrobenzene-1,2-diol dehydrogenase-like [Schistocerca gregaria]